MASGGKVAAEETTLGARLSGRFGSRAWEAFPELWKGQERKDVLPPEDGRGRVLNRPDPPPTQPHPPGRSLYKDPWESWKCRATEEKWRDFEVR